MKSPGHLSSDLRKIAAKIDASRSPSISAVAAALRKVLASVEEPVTVELDGVTWHVANPGDHDWTRNLWAFTFGATGSEHVLAWGNSSEDALEDAAQFLREVDKVGYFVSEESMGQNYDEAAAELGPGATQEAISEKAEQDLTHTEHGYIPSWEWTVDEAPPALAAAAKAACAALDGGEDGQQQEDGGGQQSDEQQTEA